MYDTQIENEIAAIDLMGPEPAGERSRELYYIGKLRKLIRERSEAAGRPLTRGEILELSVDKNWKDNSIHILLNRLLAKGAIAESGFARSGKSYGRLYEAMISGEEYYAENVFYGGPERLTMLFDALAYAFVVEGHLCTLLSVRPALGSCMLPSGFAHSNFFFKTEVTARPSIAPS